MSDGTRRTRERGMHTAEYAICFGLAIAAAVGMQTFVKRAIQARMKAGTDVIGKVVQANPLSVDVGLEGSQPIPIPIEAMEQYEPYYNDSSQTVDRSSTITETHTADTTTARTTPERIEDTTQERTASSGGEAGASALGKDSDWK